MNKYKNDEVFNMFSECLSYLIENPQMKCKVGRTYIFIYKKADTPRGVNLETGWYIHSENWEQSKFLKDFPDLNGLMTFNNKNLIKFFESGGMVISTEISEEAQEALHLVWKSTQF